MKATRLSVVASLWDTTFVLPRMKPSTRTANTGKISLAKIVNMKNGRADGEAKYWYKNGQIKEEGNWVDGKFIATAKWNEAGEESPVK